MGKWLISLYAREEDSMHSIWRAMSTNEKFTGRWVEDADTGEIRVEMEETHKSGLFSMPCTTITWIHEDHIKLMRVLECKQKEV